MAERNQQVELQTLQEQTDLKEHDQLAKLQALLEQTDLKKPGQSKALALGQALEKMQDLWGTASVLNAMARRLRLDKLPPPMRQMICKELESIQLNLGYTEAPPLERLLIENIASFWLHLQVTQLEYSAATTQSLPFDTADHLDTRLTAAQRSYLRAIESLARVRRLRRSTSLQLNIGAQQLNVAAEVNPLSTPTGPEATQSSLSANPTRHSESQTSRPLKPSEARDAQAVTSKRNRRQRSK